MSFVDAVVAREALYDHDLGVIGYELVFRHVEDASSDTSCGPASRHGSAARLREEPPAELMTASVLFSSLSVGIDKLVGEQLAFCSADRALLTGMAPLTLPPKQTVIQIRPDLTIDDEVLDCCHQLALDGYRFAVVDFAHREVIPRLLELVTYAKFDFSAPAAALETNADLQPMMSRCWDYGMKLVASRVETHEQLSACRDLGFDYFQGHALSRPRIVTGRTTQTTAAGRMRVAASLIGTEVEMDELEKIVRTEPGLIYQLMQLASVGNRDGTRRQVRTLRDALVLVGARRLQSWIALLMLTQPGVTMKEDMVVALTRARMTELLIGKVSPWLAGLGFTAGMVSAFDLMLGLPAEEIVKILPLADDLREAAFGDTSAVGRLVRDVVDHQNGELPETWRSGLLERDFDVASLKALTWAVDATRELKVA